MPSDEGLEPWEGPPDPGGEEGTEAPPPKRPKRKGRTSLRRSLSSSGPLRRLFKNPWFEPLVTILAVVVILVALYAYTGNWPPLVVIESDSMQHGEYVDTLGAINTGDLVLVKQVSVPQDVTTYVMAENTNYMTYGEPGDVLLYYKYGDTSQTPVIHRAIIWLNWDPVAQLFNAPSLADLTCYDGSNGLHGEYQVVPPGSSPSTAQCPNNLNGDLTGTIYLYDVGWQGVTVAIPLTTMAEESPHSGFITMGDDNCAPVNPCQAGPGEMGEFDQIGGIVNGLVEPSWVEGVARGMIPWFGAIKLWLSGDAQDVPPPTWDYLGATILLILVVPTVLPPVIRRIRSSRSSSSIRDEARGGSAGSKKPRRRDRQEPSDAAEGSEGEPKAD